VHATEWRNVPSILQHGLAPGRAMEGGRGHVYFAPFLPDDPRFLTGKRGTPNHDTALVFNLRTLVEDVQLYVTANGVIITEDIVHPAHIFAVYRFPVNRPRDKTCVYHKAKG
jgi:hypothetical protein